MLQVSKTCLGKCGVGISQANQVSRARTNAEFRQSAVVAGVVLQLGDAAFFVVDVAEDDRLRRAGLLAGGLQRAVDDRRFDAVGDAVLLRVDAGVVDPLDAVGALLHDAAVADGHFGVAHQLQHRSFSILILEEIEAAHLVGAVVRAVPRADAAVVGHLVETFVAVGRRRDGADDFARGVLAMLAEHRLVDRLGILGIARVVGVHPDPEPSRDS